MNGGEFMKNGKLTVNDPKIVQALEWTMAFEKMYGGPQVVDSMTSGYGTKEMDPFIMGRLAMKIDTDYSIKYLEKYGPKIEYRIAPPPAPKGMPTVTWSGGFAYAVPKGSKNSDLAWQFVKHMTNAASQLQFGKTSSCIPGQKAAVKDPFFTDDPKYKVFLDIMKVSKYRPVTPIASRLWDELVKAVEYVRVGKKTAKQALDDVQNIVDNEMTRLEKK
jgi:ABC-type glycerol-3-phosphate transport system substrate-binding protein